MFGWQLPSPVKFTNDLTTRRRGRPSGRSGRHSAALLVAGLFATACVDESPTQLGHFEVEPVFARSASVNVVGVSNVWVQTGAPYRAVSGGTKNGATSHIDRTYTLNSVPSQLRGHTYIRTAWDDRTAYKNSTEFLSFTIDRPADVYVLHEDQTGPPTWLEGWTRSGLQLLIQKSRRTAVPSYAYRMRFPAGKVTLGSNRNYPHATTPGMYVVVLVPADEPLVATVSVDPGSASVDVDASVQLNATVTDDSGNTMSGQSTTWVSDNPAVAAVGVSGLVTGLAVGTVTITATADGKSGSASVTVAPPPPPPSGTVAGGGIWMSPAELAALPTSGPAWDNLRNAADASCGTPDLSDQNDGTNVCIMAKALVYARTGTASYRDAVVGALRSIVESGTYSGRALALGRELGAYVIAADLIGLSAHDAALDGRFRDKIRSYLTTPTIEGPKSLVECHEIRPNNWGTHCGGSRVAVAAYLGDTDEMDRAARVFRGWLGDRSVYAGFKYGELDWQCDASAPVGINPKGCTKQGHSIDGVIADDQRRSGSFSWPPAKENYAWEALQGALLQAVILNRAGFDAFNWSDQALLRAVTWLHQQADYPAEGDDTWQPHLINKVYGTDFPAPVSRPGKNVGWTDWTHQR